MKATLFKELRANAPWAGLGLVGVALALAVAVYAGGDSRLGPTAPLAQPVLTQAVVSMVCGFGFAIVGFALGLLVVLEDAGVGRWALLTHRPIARGRIFLGKAIGAMAWYLVATGVPLLMLTAWAAWVASGPFDWRMVLPRLAQELAGACWIPTGMLVAARRGRWIGSRLFPAVAALLITGDAQLKETSMLVILGLLIAGPIVLGTAARSAFIADGDFESQAWIGRVIVMLTVACGVYTAMMCAAALGFELSDVTAGARGTYSYYLLANGGKLYRYDEGPAKAATPRRWTGQEFVPSTADVTNSETTGVVEGRGFGERERSLFSPTRYAEFLGPEGGRYWYWLPESRTIVAYDLLSRRRVASLGSNGIRSASEPPQPFPEPMEFIVGQCAFSAHAVWRISPPATPELLYTVPADQRIWAIAVAAWQRLPVLKGMNLRPSSVAVFTGSELQIVRSGKRVAQVALPPHRDQSAVYSFAETADHGLVIFLNPDRLLIQIAPDGREVSRTTVPPLPKSDDGSEAGRDAVTAILAPPAAVWAAAMHAGEPVGWRMEAGSAGIAALAGLLGWLRMRRCAGTPLGRWWWTAVCGLLGIGGVLLLLCMRTAAARMRCPSCGRRRRVIDDRCEHCGKPFPPPAMTGVEILESRKAVEVGR